MSLQVARKNADEPWHLIKKKFWGEANHEYLQTFMIQFFCEEEPRNRTPGKWKSTNLTIKPYEKDIHRKKVCENCAKAIIAYNKRRKD